MAGVLGVYQSFVARFLYKCWILSRLDLFCCS